MKIARAGWPMIGCGIAAAGIGSLPMAGAGKYVLAPLGLVFAGFCAYFFRDPKRVISTDINLLFSPGDGRVLSVSEEGPGEVVTLRIFLSIFDVHLQRMPCSGTVERVQYQPGTFKMAMADEARMNERNIVKIMPEAGRPPVIVEQIAGLIARRIECWVKQGDLVVAGQQYGIIHFGSQVAVHLPKGTKAVVRPGDRVVGGVTPIAKWTV